MQLHYQTVGSGEPLFILHGLFGSSDNWRSVSKALSSDASVTSVDLRNHGRSGQSVNQNYPLMAEDLLQLLDQLGLQHINLMGHSMGGKVAMTFAERYASRLKKLIVVDMAPRAYSDSHSEIFRALLAVDLKQYHNRHEVDAALAVNIADKSVRQFLLLSLYTNPEGELTWRINLKDLYANYANLLQPVCEGAAMISTPSCFIRGKHSDYISSDDELTIHQKFTHAHICTIENAGHWVHADAMNTFVETVKTFLHHD